MISLTQAIKVMELSGSEICFLKEKSQISDK